jgi:plastocyanin
MAILLLSAAPPLAATTIKMGGDEGSLNFVPASVTVPAGEKIVFSNNKGFPHNVVFEKEAVPPAVEVEKISHFDYMNDQGEQFVVVLTEKGTYKFFCEPHAAAGMNGEITVT